MKKTKSSFLLSIIMAVSFTACSSANPQPSVNLNSTGSGSISGSSGSTTTVPPDLTGQWKQINGNSDDSWHSATITKDSIDVYWVVDGGETTALYWAGTYKSPTTTNEPYSWDSENNRDKTKLALFASGDDIKTFTYENGQISYSASAFGTTTTVKLEKDFSGDSLEGSEIPERSNFAGQDEQKQEYEIGETWTVDGQWAITVTGVSETQQRNQYSDKTPGAVYIVDYTYTNIGYEGIADGLFIDLNEIIIDSEGVMGYIYPGNITYYPKRVPIGATCNAQSCIGVENPGDFKTQVVRYDDNSKKQSATFNIKILKDERKIGTEPEIEGIQIITPESGDQTKPNTAEHWRPVYMEPTVFSLKQPDYSKTATRLKASSSASQSSSSQSRAPTQTSSSTTAGSQSGQQVNADYVLNTNTKKFHHPWCGETEKIKDSNFSTFHGYRYEIIKMGYTPCKKCNP